MPTEVVRVGIGGVDLAAAVGGLRQTGFKPSDVGGGVFSGQGRRAVPGGSGGPPPPPRVTHHPPPQQPHQTVEYVQEGQEIVNADTREFHSALGGLKKTGLGSRLRETPQPQQQVQQPAPPQQLTSAAAALGVRPTPHQTSSSHAVAGQWQGLPRSQHQQTAESAAAPAARSQQQRPSWQTAAGKLRSTGLMTAGNVSGGGAAGTVGGASQGQEGQGGAPWQQGVAGLRRTGMLGGGGDGGDGAARGLDMGRLNLNDGGV